MSYAVQKLVERKNVVKVGGGRGPCVKTYEQKRGIDLFGNNDDQASVCTSVRSDRFESSQRNRGSGDILGHTDKSTYAEEVQKVHVGKKPIEEPRSSRRDDRPERPFGTLLMPDVRNSDRYEHTQRNKTSGDIIGHTTDIESETFKGGRAKVELEERPEPVDSLRVGRQRTDLPPAIAAAEGESPFATEGTPVEAQQVKTRHNNHYDHHDGLLTGGDMGRSTKKDKTPLWY